MRQRERPLQRHSCYSWVKLVYNISFLGGGGKEIEGRRDTTLTLPPLPSLQYLHPHQFQRFPTVSLHQFPSICVDENNYSQKFCALFSVPIGRFFPRHSPTRSFNKKFKSLADWYGDIHYETGGGGRGRLFPECFVRGTRFSRLSFCFTV